MMLLSQLAPQSPRILAGAPKIEIYPYHRNLATVFRVWLGVTYAMMCFIKWLQKTKIFTMFWDWSNSIVVSILIKSMCSNSKGAVTMMGCTGALIWVPSCRMHHLHHLPSASVCPFQATRTSHVASTEFPADPGVQHLGDIHSWKLLNALWGLQTAKLLPTWQLVCGNGRGLLGRVSASSAIKV